ncbi:MAG TPA: alpha-amylase family glycosyl hydrolase [Devosia sp.]|nr:alpha-amylase family glycosyl hydrolase [Devosia sp.]
MQEHKYSKSQPENVLFLQRVRALLDRFPGTTTVGEVGDSHKSVPLMAQYTSGGDKLHMCYSFDFLGPQFTAAHFRSRIEQFFKAGPDGWPCWSFSNHDVPRHITRWADHSLNPEDLGRQSAALVLTLKGSVCLYQGEELGLPETDLLFEELTDPRGIRFWPEDKGRDGCRTPIPWEAGAAPNGFTTGTPWLPLKPAQSALDVASQNTDSDSMLAFYRRILAWRRTHGVLYDGDIEFFRTAEPVLAFRRFSPAGTMTCMFNLSAESQKLSLTGLPEGAPLDPLSQNATLTGKTLSLGANGFAFLALPADAPAIRVRMGRGL